MGIRRSVLRTGSGDSDGLSSLRGLPNFHHGVIDHILVGTRDERLLRFDVIGQERELAHRGYGENAAVEAGTGGPWRTAHDGCAS